MPAMKTAALTVSLLATLATGCAVAPGPGRGIAAIDTVVVIYAENRSFDNM